MNWVFLEKKKWGFKIVFLTENMKLFGWLMITESAKLNLTFNSVLEMKKERT